MFRMVHQDTRYSLKCIKEVRQIHVVMEGWDVTRRQGYKRHRLRPQVAN